MSHPLHGLLAALAVTVLVVGTGVWLSGPEPREPVPYEGTLLSSYDTSVVAIAREPFCDLIPSEAVEAALGGPADQAVSWVDGDELDGVGVVHEFGCRMEAGRAEASAWVLAPPVTAERAGRLASDAAEEQKCRSRSNAPAYGEPSVALLCPRKNRTFASYRGLFGDAWLACTVAGATTLKRAELLDRADRWCVAVAEAARR